MKRYSIFHPLVLSFFSKSLYRDVGRNWRGTGLAYLILVLALLWIPTVIKFHRGMKGFVDRDAKKITEQIPGITISHGKVSTDVPTPYFIKDSSGSPLMIIDTTGQYQTLDDTPAQVLLTKSNLIARQGTQEVKTYDLAGVESFSVDRARVEGWLSIASRWFIPVVYPLALLFSFIARAIQVLIYALIGILFARMLQVNLDYKALMRLAAVSLTPILVLDLIFEFVPLHIPLGTLFGICVALGYLFLAIKWNSDPAVAQPDEAQWIRPSTMP